MIPETGRRTHVYGTMLFVLTLIYESSPCLICAQLPLIS